MKVNEIKEQLEQQKTLDGFIEIKHYLSFIEKKLLCQRIIDGSIDTENNMMICDNYVKKINFDIGIVINYTNIELDEESFIGDYDILCETGTMRYILENMNQDERWFIVDMVDTGIESKLMANNSMEAIANNALGNLIRKIPNDKDLAKLLKAANKEFSKFDISKLKALAETMHQ